MTKKQKNNLVKTVVAGTVGFLVLVFTVPLIKIKPVALGEDPTMLQKIHEWFTKTKDFFNDNLLWIALLIGGALALYYFLKKK